MEYLNLKSQHRPEFIINARRKIKTMTPGEHLIIKCDDPLAIEDIPKYCTISGNRLIMASTENGTTVFEILIN